MDNHRGRNGYAMSNTLQSVHPELVSEWSDKNLPLTPNKITFSSNKRVWWKGSCGHEYFFHGEETTHGSIKVTGKISGENHPFVEHYKFVKHFLVAYMWLICYNHFVAMKKGIVNKRTVIPF